MAGPFDFRSLFGNERSAELEIGIGKGRFLLAQAAGRPEVNFLGIEWSLKYLRLAKERAQRQGLRNVRLFRADARHVLAALLPDRSVVRVHVYCPDPWPKKRHRKRRLLTPATVAHIERVLVPGGYLDLSTDVAEYFDEIRELVPVASGLRVAEDPLFPIESPGGRTSYEAKYIESGRSIHRATYVRPGDAAEPGAVRAGDVKGSRR
ncbi:MAG: tRNA (guanosine(46)-N7)-methyltransferase TrmB [Acidobacteria bacterium 13_1_40CM_2_68_10]|nr:MAG: tRNA (guanosine(46)-N7)-methyltransferase TrmB [Acidobacteria bacterium 13_1_40CM_2_68_10]